MGFCVPASGGGGGSSPPGPTVPSVTDKMGDMRVYKGSDLQKVIHCVLVLVVHTSVCEEIDEHDMSLCSRKAPMGTLNVFVHLAFPSMAG